VDWGTLLLFATLTAGAAVTIRPLWSDLYLAGGDIPNHVRLLASAAHELAAGRWLLSFVNDSTVAFQPYFRYYTVTASAMGGVIKIVSGTSAYKALLVYAGLAFIVAGIGVYRLCRYFRADRVLAVLAACAYAFSPYAFDNLYHRGDTTEFSVNALWPLAMYGFLRCYATAGRRYFWRSVALAAILMLTHKIMLPWFFCLMALFVAIVALGSAPLSTVRWRRLVSRALPVGVAVVIGFLIVAPYWLEAYAYALPRMVMAKFVVLLYEYLTQGWRSLWPFYSEAPGAAKGTGIAVQVGAPAVVGLLLACLFWRRPSRLAAAVVAAVSLAFVVSLGNPWRFTPAVFQGIQFPYRLLSMVTLYGSLGLALAATQLAARRPRARGAVLVFVGAIVAWTSVEFYRPPPSSGPRPDARQWEHGDIGLTVFAEWPAKDTEALMADRRSFYDPTWVATLNSMVLRFYGQVPSVPGAVQIPRSSVNVQGGSATVTVTAERRTLYVFPLQYTELNRASDSGRPVDLINVDAKAAAWLDPGVHAIAITRGWWPVGLVAAAIGLIAVVIISISPWRGSRRMGL
jgi:hypothetical protein